MINRTCILSGLATLSVLALIGCDGYGYKAGHSSKGDSNTLAVEQSSNLAGVEKVESDWSSCNMPQLTAYEDLPEIAELPDPFLAANGKRISKRSQWPCRRAELAAQMQRYELGQKPMRPQSVDASMDGNNIVVKVKDRGREISFNAEIIPPSAGHAPYPVMIGIGKSWLNNDVLSQMGVAVINFPNNEIAEQKDPSSRGKGKFFDIYSDEKNASALIAWAWGVSRLIDALASTPAANIDATRVGVTGCSRNGKGALVAGAFDQRIALTISQESGSGGAASWRVSDAQLASGTKVQTASEIVNENVWQNVEFQQFANSVTKLPFDHHELEGMIAPRSLLVIENTSIDWLGNLSTYTTAVAAHTIWQSMGVGERMGFSQVGGHNHCQYPDSQLPELRAYVGKFLVGREEGDTRIMKTDGDLQVDTARWMPWSVPKLN